MRRLDLRSFWKAWWPWFAVASILIPAAWHVLDFPEDVDGEFPNVVRPTFNPLPPPAYRLAEPGDTLDRIGIYISAGACLLGAIGLRLSVRDGKGVALWPAAIVLSLVSLYYVSTPLPTYDGYHGIGFGSMFDPATPHSTKVWIASGLGLAAVLVAANAIWVCSRVFEFGVIAREAGARGLLIGAAVLVILRQFDFVGLQPVGYWTRCAYDAGILAFLLAIVRCLPPIPPMPRRRRVAIFGLSGAAWLGIVLIGINLTWYHRPLWRLKELVPGKIYISAMPTYRGLQVAHARHGFKTIINLYNEDGEDRSPYIGEELRFVKENGIRYLNSPPNGLVSDPFFDETLRIAQDPNAWPILVHCHGCNDRTPAWSGAYQFLVENKPLQDIIVWIERHRGCRPKAVVTLLFNRILERRAPERYAADPVGRMLKENARGTTDPYFDMVLARAAERSKGGSKKTR